MNDKADEITEEPFYSLRNRYQNNLESMKGLSSIMFIYVIIIYNCHKINLNHGGSYIDSPDCIKNKKINNKSYHQSYKNPKNPIINPIKKITCFQYALTVVLSYEEIN